MSFETKTNHNWLMDRLFLALHFLGRAIYEPFRAAFCGDAWAIWGFTYGCIAFVVFIFGIDGKILLTFGKGGFYDNKWYASLQLLIAILPVLSLGIYTATLRTMFILDLRKSFDRCGLQNALKEYPNFISLESKNNESLRLRLTNNGLSLNDWRSKKDRIEANLKVFIDTIEMVQDKGIIELTFSTKPMPTEVGISYFEKYRGYKFFVGKNRTQEFEIDFTVDPHLLVAGESGGGKTNFIRQMVATLKFNHPETMIKLFDFKANGDFGCFEGLDRMEIAYSRSQAPKILDSVVTDIQNRAETLRKLGFSSLDLYHSSNKFLDKSKEDRKMDPCGYRIFVVVDEYAELVLDGGELKHDEVKSCKESLSKISRLGRSCGVHLVLATQRPDRRTVDVQVKSNLTSTVCFRLNDLGGSLAVLGSKSACELPMFKGRGIFQRGSVDYEIQAPFVTAEFIQRHLGNQNRQENGNVPQINL